MTNLRIASKYAYCGRAKHKGLMMRWLLGIALGFAMVGAAMAQSVYPSVGPVTTLTTGSAAQVIVTAHVNGCYVTNPLTATGQGIGSAEVVDVNPTGTATLNGGNTGNSELQPGQTYTCPANMATDLSAVAATSGHKLSVVRW